MEKWRWRGIGAVFALGAILLLAGDVADADPAGCPWTIVRAIDGDTLLARVPCLPEPLQRVGIRVVGVDTPEAGSHARCERERDLAARATAMTEALVLRSGRVEMEFEGWDRYGRALAVVMVNGEDLAGLLVAAGLGRLYDGGRRLGWCG